jgi:hypothetical protein
MSTRPQPWLPGLIVPTPETGYDLAPSPPRMVANFAQPSDESRNELHCISARGADALIAAWHVVELHVQAAAAARFWWLR